MNHILKVLALIVWAALLALGLVTVPMLAFQNVPLAWTVLVCFAVVAVGGVVVLARDRRRNPWTALAQQRKKLALQQASNATGIGMKHLQYVEDEQARTGHVVDKRTGQPVLVRGGA